MFIPGWIQFILLFLPGSISAQEPKVVSVADFGSLPGDKKNTLNAVKAALYVHRKEPSLVLTFPKGRYDFWADSVTGSNRGISLYGKKNITIDGNNSEFIFHGKMTAVFLEGAESISLKNFSVDWDRPYVSQGRILNSTPDAIDIEIDKKAYPYAIEGDSIVFLGEGWRSGITLYNLYDKNRKEIVYRTQDRPLGNNFFRSKAKEISEGIVRFYGKPFLQPEAGTYVSLLHTRYLSAGIQIVKSKDVTLSNIDIYHALSMGIVATRSENISLDDVNVMANEAKGRVFSAIADASHFAGCKGFIKVTNCAHSGQADDFINIHGEYIPVVEKIDDKSVRTNVRARNSEVKNLVDAGDQMWLVDKINMQRGEAKTVKSVLPLYDSAKKLTGYQISFVQKLPSTVAAGDHLENKTWNPSVEIRNCKILKKHRARGILITTSEKVVIENNYFNTAGAAILVEGDTNHWMESGACTSVQIRNNVFEDCLTSGTYWGEAVITVSPSFRPSDVNSPAYHKNINIENNVFRHFDYAVLYARSAGNLSFKNNKLIRTQSYQPFSEKVNICLDGCRNVNISGNKVNDDFLGKNIQLYHMADQDLRLQNKEFTVENKKQEN